jgi:spore germination cell wall hydrolase CwlJ-like protein
MWITTKMDYNQTDVRDLANVIYGEAANQPPEVMKMVGSTVVNRRAAGRGKEFGETLPEIINKGYYAASNPNVPYRQAMMQQFPDEESINKYKQAISIAAGLLRGTIEPDKGQFYFTGKEIKKLKKTPKRFNFNAVKEVGRVGDYIVFSY